MIQTQLQSDVAAESQVADIVDEITERLSRGEELDVEEYAERYPSMAPMLHRVIETLRLLREPATSHLVSETPPGLDSQIIGQLGDFRILREIGRGGMGVVYEAEQISLGRRVALKILPFAAVLDPKQLQRFKNEAQAAAHLKHPHIVGVYSVGCERGVHYYAMEFIEGANLGELIEQLRQPSEPGVDDRDEKAGANRRLARDLTTGRLGAQAPTPRRDDSTGSYPTAGPPITGGGNKTPPDVEVVLSPASGSTRCREFFRSVARLGIQAAEALEHAHELGVVHRDIKPSNLMVDSQGHLWVTDFGLALTSTNGNLTMTGDVVGTLRYMSPEQVSGQRTRLDYHTDVYSLGVTLWELLTLTPVYPQEDRQQLLRQILEEEPRPARQLNPAIPKDLETIVFKATAKEPQARYATAQALADDLGHFLNEEPIEARPPTVVERITKWSLRNRSVVVSAAVLLVMLAIASVASTAFIWREQKRTERAAAESKAVLDFLVNDLLAASNPARTKGREVTVKEVLARAEDKIDTAFEDQPLVEASVQNAMGDAYGAIGRHADAEQHYSRALELRKEALGPEHPDTLNSMGRLANALLNQGRLSEARKRNEELLELQRRILGPEHPDTLYTMHNLALVLQELDRHAEAGKLYEETLELSRRILGPEDLNTVNTMSNLANVLRGQGRLSEARKLHEEVLELRRRILGPDHLESLKSMKNLANVLFEQGKRAEACQLIEQSSESIRRMMGPEHPDTLSAMNDLAWVLHQQSRLPEACKLSEKTLELKRRIQGPEHPETLTSTHNLAHVLWSQRRLEEARKLYEETLELRRRILGPENPHTLSSMNNLAVVLKAQGSYPEARKLHEETLELRRRIRGPEHPDTIDSMFNLATVLQAQGLSDKAIAQYRETIRIDPQYVSAHYNLANALQAQGKLDEAIAKYREAIRIDPEHASAHIGLGVALRAQGKLDEAIAEYRMAIRIDPDAAAAHTNLGNTFEDQGRLGEAVAEYREAIRIEPEHPIPQNNLAWLLATSIDPKWQKPGQALEHAKKAVTLLPVDANHWATLGVAHYRNGEWDEAISALKKAAELGSGGSDIDWLFLAMAHWQLGHTDEARDWYHKAVERMTENKLENEELRRFRAEAAELLGINDEKAKNDGAATSEQPE